MITGDMTDPTTPDRLGALAAAGVSIWFDDLSRERSRSGNLQSLIAEVVSLVGAILGGVPGMRLHRKVDRADSCSDVREPG